VPAVYFVNLHKNEIVYEQINSIHENRKARSAKIFIDEQQKIIKSKAEFNVIFVFMTCLFNYNF
jgi:hypothetical protein